MRRFFLLVGSINACLSDVDRVGGEGGGIPPIRIPVAVVNFCIFVFSALAPERKICRGEFITTTTSRTQTTCYTTMGCCYSSPHNVRAYRDPGDLDEEIGPLR